MTDKNIDKAAEMFINDYLNKKGIFNLEELSEEEFNELCSNAQIDAYLAGRFAQWEENNASSTQDQY